MCNECEKHRKERLAQDKQIKNEIKQALPQPPGFLPANESANWLLREQHEEMHNLPTELSTASNPKTMAKVKQACEFAEPE